MKKKSFNAILTLMRVFLLLIAIGLSSVYANPVLGQVKVDIDVKSVSIEEVFKEIQKKSDYVFFYKDNVLKNNKKISLKLNNVKVSKILDQVFLNTDLNYIIVEKQIVVKKLRIKIQNLLNRKIVRYKKKLCQALFLTIMDSHYLEQIF